MTRSRERAPDHPAAVYRDSLSRGSYWAVHHSLTTIADLLGGGDPWTYAWEELGYADTARVRARLVERYAPATVNKMLTVLRGVLKTCWRLSLMDAETYSRAADVANVRAKTLPVGRGVVPKEVAALLEACTADTSPAGRRDAALVAILYGTGLRRAELCGLDLADFDEAGCLLTVRAGKGRRDRQVFLTPGACRLLRAWV
jgi:integrase